MDADFIREEGSVRRPRVRRHVRADAGLRSVQRQRFQRQHEVQPAPPRCGVSARRLPSLLERLPPIPDPRGRKGRWPPWRAVLGIIALAKLSGVAGGQRDLADFAQRLNQHQHRHLRCRRNPKTGRYAVPGPTTFFRALSAVDYPSFERVVLDWQDDLLGLPDPNELVVLDGQSINAAGQMTVCALSVPSGRVHGLEPVRPKDPELASDDLPLAGAPVPPEALTASAPARFAPELAQPAAPKSTPKKENEIPAARRLLARANLAGRLVRPWMKLSILRRPAPGWGEDQDVYALAVQADGKILVGGDFGIGGILRLNADGSPDTGFSQQWNRQQWVEALCEQADGKILIAGGIASGGAILSYVSRLNAEGTKDGSFNPVLNAGVGAGVGTFALQTDGKILIGGNFTIAGTQTHSNLARLNPDGTLDEEFKVDVDGWVSSIAVQNDGKILLAGSFTRVAGQLRNGIARLNNTGPATQSLTRSDSMVTWLRGGASPEVTRTTLEHSNDGVTWSRLGDGVRIPGGWRLAGISLPAEGVVRARGHVFGGQNEDSGSGGIVETTVATYQQPQFIQIPYRGAASPYPSSLQVSNWTGTVRRVVVTLHRFSHSAGTDVEVLLVGPGGQSVVLMSAAGQTGVAGDVTLTFDDLASESIDEVPWLTSGTFRPSRNDGEFTSPAPRPPYGSAMSVFNGIDPNGRWDLYVYDTESEDAGRIAGGWSLSLESGTPPPDPPTGPPAPGALDKWHGRFNSPTNTLLSVASGPNGFVAVGAPGAILTSTDGVEWTNRVSGTNTALRGVGYGNGTFVAVGDGVILTSTDGVAWSNRLSGTNASLRDVAYGDGRFVAVGESGTIRVSSDGGATWQAASSGSNYVLTSVTYGQGRFVAVGSLGIIHTSADGINWVTVRPPAAANSWISSVAFGGGQFVAVGSSRTILTSPDGISWTRRTAPPGIGFDLNDVIYANGSYVCGGSGTLLNSSNGINWMTNVPPTTSYYIYGLAFDGETFVAVGVNSTNPIFQSDPVFLRPPRVVRPPRDTIVRLSGMTNLNVIAAGTSPFTYRWQRNGVSLPGATNAVLTFSNTPVTAEAHYIVTVGNTLGVVTSSPAFLHVGVPPSVALQPLDQAVAPGGLATFSIEMNGTPPFHYRWRQPGTIYTMLTNLGRQSFFPVPNAGVAHEGVYGVLVSNNFGSVLSRGAQLTILADADADGLPDVWETAHRLNMNDLADAMLDLDNDGLSNLEEFRAGTNPTNAGGVLALRAFRTNEMLMLEFEAESNRTYTVQRANALDSGAWARLIDFAARTNRRIETFVEPAATTNRYYRLITPRQP